MQRPATLEFTDPKTASYARGYEDAKKSNDRKRTDLLKSFYAPVAGFEAEYQAGWDKAQSEEDKKTVRSFGVATLILGASVLIAGAIGFYVCFVIGTGTGVWYVGGMFFFGGLIVSGLGFLTKGLVRVISGRDLDEDFRATSARR
jgi:hypothetical protein